MQIQTTTIKFPEIELRVRDGHKLRGFFGSLFKEYSEILHNHYADGTERYKYPLVQYKVVNRIPHIIGIQDGANLLIDLFLKMDHLIINNKMYPVSSKNIENSILEVSGCSKLHEYRFATLWMGLNQSNYQKYSMIQSNEEKHDFLNRQLQNNILSFYKGIGYYAKERIMANGTLSEKSTQFKNQRMLAFQGTFVTNALIPNLIGIGKSVSRGFGAVQRKERFSGAD